MSAASAVDFVGFLARSIVHHPDEVEVSERDDGGHRMIDLRVAQPDLAVVIGRGGRTAMALRTALDAFTWKHHQRARLHIVEDDRPPRDG